MLKQCIFKNDVVTFFDQGKGRVVVLLHGFLGSHQIWKDTISSLSKNYRVIAIDLPGHGNTANYGYAHSMDLMAHCVKSVLDFLRLKKVVIIGHSMGGYAALAFADLYPDTLKGLCLYHSTAYEDNSEKKKDRLRAIELVKKNRTVYTKETIKNLFAKKNLKYLKNEIAFATKIAKSTKKEGIVASLRGMKDRPSRDLILGLVTYPIMMVIGEHDNVLNSQSLIEQSKLLKKPSVLYLEHDGHFGFLESPIVSHIAIKKFLRKCY